VVLRTQASARWFRSRADGRVRSVLLSDGTELHCDAVLVAAGVEPERRLVPTVPGGPVHVRGDAAGGGHWAGAASDAVDVARRLLGLEPLLPAAPFFWSDQFGLRQQLVGEPAGAARIELEGSADDFVARYRTADGRLLAALAANRRARSRPFAAR
jgi:Reductase C-terminal